MRAGKILVEILTGIAAGTILGLLVAPEKGSKSRRKISKRGFEAMKDISDKLDVLTDSVSGKFANAKSEA